MFMYMCVLCVCVCVVCVCVYGVCVCVSADAVLIPIVSNCALVTPYGVQEFGHHRFR